MTVAEQDYEKSTSALTEVLKLKWVPLNKFPTKFDAFLCKRYDICIGDKKLITTNEAASF